MIAISAFAVLITAAALKFRVSSQLLYHYRVDAYLSTSKSRLLYALHLLTPLVMGVSLLILSYCTTLLWVEIPAWILLALIIWHCGRAAYIRLSGRYGEYYKRHRWK